MASARHHVHALNTSVRHRNDVPVEYTGEEQAICAVGLVEPRQGVFMAAIQHLLVLCTPVEVCLGWACIQGQGKQPAAGIVLI